MECSNCYKQIDPLNCVVTKWKRNLEDPLEEHWCDWDCIWENVDNCH